MTELSSSTGMLLAYTMKQKTPRELSFPEWEAMLVKSGLRGRPGRKRNHLDEFRRATQALDNLKMCNGETGDEKRIFRFYLCKTADDALESQRILAYAEIDEAGKEVTEGVNLFRFKLDKETQVASYEPMTKYMPSRFVQIAEETVTKINMFGGSCSGTQIRAVLTRALEATAIPTGVNSNWIFSPTQEDQAKAFYDLTEELNAFMGEKFVTVNIYRPRPGEIFEGLTVEDQVASILVNHIGDEVDATLKEGQKRISEAIDKAASSNHAWNNIQKVLDRIKDKVACYVVSEDGRKAVNDALLEARRIAEKAMKTEEELAI